MLSCNHRVIQPYKSSHKQSLTPLTPAKTTPVAACVFGGCTLSGCSELERHALRRRQVMVEQQRGEQPHQVRHGELEDPHRQLLPRGDLQSERVVKENGVQHEGGTEVDQTAHAREKWHQR